ncbi:MAG: nickel-dependent lactate racemase [bacterium]
MVDFKLKYGFGHVDISLPEAGVISGKPMRPIADAPGAIKTALAKPINSKPLKQIVKPKETVAIVVSDYTRVTKAEVFLPILVNQLNEAGILDQDIFIVFANGTHLAQTKEQQDKIVGPEIVKRIKLFDHDANDASNLVDLGKTSRGTPLKLNKKVYQADRKILTGSITYHYFAGFGGGRKAVLPGIAGYETIQTNHRLSMQPECTTAALDDNPLSLDMEEGAKKLKPDFILNTVLNENKELCGVFAGELIAAHRAGCKFIDDYAKVPIKEKADLVIAACGGGTTDINYVQAHKGMENAHFALKEGGVMILLGECSEGFPKQIYLDYIKLGSAQKIHEELTRKFTIPGHTVYATFWKAERYKIIWVSKLPEDTVRSIGITPASSFAQAYELTLPWLPKNPKTCVMPVAYTTFPVI